MAAAKYSSQYISDRFLPDKVRRCGWGCCWGMVRHGENGSLLWQPWALQRWAEAFGLPHLLTLLPPPSPQAIDLIDEAGSRVRLRHAQLPEEARELDKELRALLKEKDAAVRCVACSVGSLLAWP